MSEVDSDGRYRMIKEQIQQKAENGEKEEDVTMWKIEDEIENRGVKKGIQDGEMLKTINLTRKKYEKGKEVAEAASHLEEDVSVIQLIYELIEKYSDKDDKYILEQYQKVSCTK